MQMMVPPGNNGDLREERTQRLVAFATAAIEGVRASDMSLESRLVLALARCGESPVARALVALRPLMAAHGLSARLVFSDEDATINAFIADSSPSGSAGHSEVRIVRDPRLRDAHEQLIIGQTSIWFGDCLRRDMRRRDLFEQFLEDAPDRAGPAAHAFGRLWARAEPCLSLPALATDSLAMLTGRKQGGPTGTVLC